MTRNCDARLVRLDEPGWIPEDPPSVTLETAPPPPVPTQAAPSMPVLPAPPDSRSPDEWVIAESVCISRLVKLYGWHWIGEGILCRPGK